MKKRLPYILLFLFASALVWFGMMFKQAISRVPCFDPPGQSRNK